MSGMNLKTKIMEYTLLCMMIAEAGRTYHFNTFGNSKQVILSYNYPAVNYGEPANAFSFRLYEYGRFFREIGMMQH